MADFLVPHRHLPWRGLDVEAPVGLATGTKISLIALAPSRVCLNKLDQARRLDYAQAAPKKGAQACGWNIAANMTGASGSKFRPHTVTAQCSIVLASYIWLREVDRHAQTYLGSGLKKTHHAGTYSCRRQRGNGSGAWSEHAFANAWDVTGFELADGRVISIFKHWRSDGSKTGKARRKFLRKTRASACQLFNVVLTPDYNTAHKDHFHLDQGPSSSCH
ncbi:MAG: extensin family protein [Robiginitomaculum sp.]|nr:extensin family protein [Robiginitomaculum sp.]